MYHNYRWRNLVIRWRNSVILMMTILLMLMPTKVLTDPLLDSIVEKAIEHNPAIKSSLKQISIEHTKVDQVTALPDPIFSLSYSNVPIDNFQLNETPMSGIQFMASQNLPWPGKLTAQGQISEAMVLVQEDGLKLLKLKIRQDVKQYYYELFYLGKAIQSVEKNIQILTSLNEIATAKYAFGNGTQSDLLKLQVEITRLESRKISLNQKRKRNIAALNTLLDAAPDSEITVTEDIYLSDINLSLNQGTKILTNSHPRLAKLEAARQVAEKKEQRAKMSFRPDFQFQAGYRFRDNSFPQEMNSDDLFSVTVGVKVPLYNNSKRAALLETRLEQEKSRHDFEDARRILIGALADALFQLKEIRQQITLYETSLLSQAEQSLDTARSAYQVNEVDFLTLLNNLMTLFNLEIELDRQKANHEQAVAKIEFILGLPLSQIDKKAD